MAQMHDVETRNEQDGSMVVEGYAAIFDSPTVLWESNNGWQYIEVIERSAFNGANMSDVILNYNHMDNAFVLARTKNSTLQLTVDSKGLRVRAEIADTMAGNDVFKLVKRGDLSQMSFAFDVNSESWEDDNVNKKSVRRITGIKNLYDVSIVDRPAYDDTYIEARSKECKQHFEKRQLDKKRKRLLLMTY